MKSNEQIIEEINRVLDLIRPYLQRDGGDLEFVRYDDGVVYVRMMGACVDCIGLDDTLYGGIQEALIEEVPEVIEVRAV